MVTCPCCSDQLLRHVRQSKIYWFCPVCYQEMPVLEQLLVSDLDQSKVTVTQP
jgi:C4-type Zn-finger protein